MRSTRQSHAFYSQLIPDSIRQTRKIAPLSPREFAEDPEETSPPYPHYLIRFDELEELMKKESRLITFQEAMSRGILKCYKEIRDCSSSILHVRQQWTSKAHPDPNGVATKCLIETLRKLRNGMFNDVYFEKLHSEMIEKNVAYKTTASEWKSILSDAYVFLDFLCAPLQLKNDPKVRQKVYRSYPYYIKRSTFSIALAPIREHVGIMDIKTGRREFRTFRTWRKDPMCIYTVFASLFMSQNQTILLIQSVVKTPVSSMSLLFHFSSFSLLLHKLTTTTYKTNRYGSVP